MGVDEVGDLLEEGEDLEAHCSPSKCAKRLAFGEGEEEGADAEGEFQEEGAGFGRDEVFVAGEGACQGEDVLVFSHRSMGR